MHELLESKLEELFAFKGELFDSSRYSIFSGGKRLRPLILLSIVKDLGGEIEKALLPACALELIHTYSLIHDDLPCMDNDDMRRGRPTLHKVFPQWQALLTGDFLLTYAFELLSTSCLTDRQRVELITLYSKCAGMSGMVGGQLLDMLSGQRGLELDQLSMLHLMKTGGLMVAACCGAAIILDLPQPPFRELGERLGLAFQIMDDIIDVTSQKGSDERNGKTTYVTLLGLEGARKAAGEQHTLALQCIHSIFPKGSLMEDLALRLVHRAN